MKTFSSSAAFGIFIFDDKLNGVRPTYTRTKTQTLSKDMK